MTTPEEIRGWLREVIANTGLSVSELAVRSGVARSTIFRAMKPEYQFITSSRTLAKIAAAAGVPPLTLHSEPASQATVTLPVRYEVAAGSWRATDDSRDEPFGFLEVPRLAPYEHCNQWLEKVVGDSYDRLIPPGSYVHVIDAIDLSYSPRQGDTVVIARRRAQGAFEERTLKQVQIDRHGDVQLWPMSHNTRWQEPLDYMAGLQRDKEESEVVIVGKVARSYQVFGD